MSLASRPYRWVIKPLDAAFLRWHTHRKAVHARKLKVVKQQLAPYSALSTLERRGKLTNDAKYANLIRGRHNHELDKLRHDSKCDRIKARMKRHAAPAVNADTPSQRTTLTASSV